MTGAAVAARGRRSKGRTLLGAALLVAGTPLILRGVEWPTRELWVRGWFKLGQERISLDYGNAWTVLSLPDTSLSWYGAVGALVVVGGGVAMIARVAQRRDNSAALLCALAPLMFVMILSLAVVYDPWRGRMFVFAVGLACAAWAWTLRVRWLAAGVAVLTATTVATTLVHAYTKPAGRGIFEPPLGASIWGLDRIEALTVIRNNDGTPDILRAVERLVPTDADLAVGAPIDTFLAPLAGPRLRRKLYLVKDGYRTPSQARWLVTLAPAVVIGCRDAWEVAHSDAYGWRLLRRVAPETCGRGARPLRSRV